MSGRLRTALLLGLSAGAFALSTVEPHRAAAARPAHMVVVHEEADGRLRVALGTDPANDARFVELTIASGPELPTIDIRCDGRARTFALKASHQLPRGTVAIYDVPRPAADVMVRAAECRLVIPGRVIALPRDPRWAAWAEASKGAAPPKELAARVLEVVDGDTIKVQLGDRAEAVRYIGIDAPEMTDPNTVVEPGAREAAEVNRHLVAGRHVRLELDVQERDRFGRLLAYVWVGDRMANAEMVRRGYAQLLTMPPNVRHQELLARLHREAKAQRAGLWAPASAPAAPPPPAMPPPPAEGPPTAGLSPLANGACPATHIVKGNFTTSSGERCIYHVPGGLYYGATKPERCYATEEQARQDGCRPSKL